MLAGGLRATCYLATGEAPRAPTARSLAAGALRAARVPAVAGSLRAPATGKTSAPLGRRRPLRAGDREDRRARPAVAVAWPRRGGLAARALELRERREGRWKERRDKGKGRRERMNG